MLKGLFIFLNILALIVLLLSCMAAYVNPSHFWLLSFLGFAFPVALIINFCFLLVWIARRKSFGLVTLIAIVLSWKFIQSTFAMHFHNENKEQGIKLMTWNVKNFDLYNWSHNLKTRKEMMALIRKEKPDILCMQEFYSNNQLFHNLEYIRDTLGYPYFYFPPAVELNKLPKSKLQSTLWKTGVLNQRWGVAIFSRYPITDSGKVNINGTLANDCIYADLDINNEKVRLYNVHFQSIHLGYDDYATLDSLEDKQQTDWIGLEKIMRKMKRATVRRSQQANVVAENMKEFQGKEILCGDFNDIPVSYTYKTVRGELQDAFVEKGKGFGATFVNKLSIFRIDYALFDPSFSIHSYKTTYKDLSDHYPVCVTFLP